MSKEEESPWVVGGGKAGEMAHCTRCGAGLIVSLPQSLTRVADAITDFDKKHSQCTPSGYAEPTPDSPEEWAAGRDVSVSALTIYSVLTGMPTTYGRYDTPRNSSDFGTCYRLLTYFPQFRDRLIKVAHHWPQWLPLVTNWEELERLYVAGVERGSGEALSLRLRELNNEYPTSGGATMESND